MSTMMDAGAAMDGGSAQNTVTQFPMQTRRIKRIGSRPLVFEGTELAMAMSYSAQCPYWYEINLYRTTEQRYVATVRQFFISETEEDRAQGWDFDDLDEAVEKLLQYDAAQDVALGLGMDINNAQPAELSSYAMDLKAQVEDHRHHYASLVGEFLYDLDTGS